MAIKATAIGPDAFAAAPSAPLLELRNLVKHFPVGGFLGYGRRTVKAVDGVSMTVQQGDSLGVVGESGCGKTTLGRLSVGLEVPTSGSVIFDGVDPFKLAGASLRSFRRDLQMTFQDPYGSLNPRMTVGDIIAEPLKIQQMFDSPGANRVHELLDLVGLAKVHAKLYPHEFSGGQRQRIAIARSLALNPRLLVLDEPVSALDVSIQAQVLNLFADLQAELNLTYLFISHNLAVVRQLCQQVAVMYLGRIVEIGPTDEVLNSPDHPYTKALVSAVPVADPAMRGSSQRIILRGDLPSPVDLPSGCRFHTRCPLREHLADSEICETTDPLLRLTNPDRRVACHFDSSGNLEPGSTREMP